MDDEGLDARHLVNQELARQSKVAPVMSEEWCPHPQDRLSLGANQHAAWVTCLSCHARWKAPNR